MIARMLAGLSVVAMLGASGLLAAPVAPDSRAPVSDECKAAEAALKKVTEQLKTYDDMLTRADETDAFYRKDFAWMNTLLSANAPISMPGAMKITVMALRENLVQQLEKIHVYKGQVAEQSASLAVQEDELKKKKDAVCEQHSELPNGSPLDGLPLDTRARLAVAACAYPPSEAPILDPDSPSFKADAAAEYLETNEDGNYGVSLNIDGVEIWYSLLRFPDAVEAAAGLKHWQDTGAGTTALNWGGSFPAYWRKQETGGPIVARGQAGRWHLVISSADTRPGGPSQAREIDAAIAAMRVLTENAKRFRIFPRELVVQYQVAGTSRRLGPGDSLQVPLDPDAEARAAFSLQILDSGKPVEHVSYKVKLSGALAAFADLEQGGSRERRSFAEAQSLDGEPVMLTWIFPPATGKDVSSIIDHGDTSLTVAIEARPVPMVLP